MKLKVNKLILQKYSRFIGVKTNRILKLDTKIVISNSRKIVEVTKRIIHGYDSVSDDVIWRIVIRNLPVLQKEVEELLGEELATNIKS